MITKLTMIAGYLIGMKAFSDHARLYYFHACGRLHASRLNLL